MHSVLDTAHEHLREVLLVDDLSQHGGWAVARALALFFSEWLSEWLFRTLLILNSEATLFAALRRTSADFRQQLSECLDPMSVQCVVERVVLVVLEVHDGRQLLSTSTTSEQLPHSAGVTGLRSSTIFTTTMRLCVHASTGHLKGVLGEYVSHLSRVRLIRSTRRLGVGGCRALGASRAGGEVLVFMDSHCECQPGWLEPLLERVAQDRWVDQSIP